MPSQRMTCKILQWFLIKYFYLTEEDNGVRYWFVDREDMEWGIKNHEFLEYGEHNGNLYGTKLDSVRAIIDEGKTCILDSSPQSLKILRNSSEFMPFIIFLSAPGLDEMRHIYDNLRVTNSMIASSKNLASFERNSSIRYSSRRARTLESLSSLYVEEDVMKNLEESARLQVAPERGSHIHNLYQKSFLVHLTQVL